MKTRFEQLAALRDAWAAVSPRFWTAPGLPEDAVSAEAALMRGDGPTPGGGRVLHLGCGDGRLTRAMGPSVVGVDVSAAMVAAGAANGLLDGRGWGGPGEPLPGGPYAGIVLDTSWLGWPAAEFGALLHAAAEALSPGGWLRLPVVVGHEPAPEGWLLAPRSHALEAWTAWFEAAGLDVATLDDPTPGWRTVRRVGAVQARPALPAAEVDLSEAADVLYAHWMAAADVAAEAGRGPEAEGCLEQATATWPQGREGWMQWTFHRLALGDLRGAALLTEAWSEALPEDAEAWLRRAEVAEAREKPGEARKALRRAQALGLEGHLADAAAALGEALLQP